MFAHWIEFQLAPGKEEAWEAYVPPYLKVQASQPGGVCFRVMRPIDGSPSGVAWRVWLSEADAERATASPEIIKAGAPARNEGFYASPGAIWHPRELHDFEPFDQWPEVFLEPGSIIIELSADTATSPLPGVIGHERMRLLGTSGPEVVIETIAKDRPGSATASKGRSFRLQFAKWGPAGPEAYRQLVQG